MIQKRKLIDTTWDVVNWLFPPICVGCGDPGEAICSVCQLSIERIPIAHCQLCGIPLTVLGICKNCQSNSPAYDELFCYAYYSGLIRKSVQQLKYIRDLGMGRELAKLLAADVNMFSAKIDLVIPMPLSKQRLKLRGYNQSAAITSHLTQLLGWTHMPQALKKIKDTESQVHLTVAERLANLDGAFEADIELVEGKRVLILDDVFTTGATMRQATKALKIAGASRIFAVTIARTLMIHEKSFD